MFLGILVRGENLIKIRDFCWLVGNGFGWKEWLKKKL